MKVALSWLKDLVEIDDSVEQLAARLSMAGFEVESIQDLSLKITNDIKTNPGRFFN